MEDAHNKVGVRKKRTSTIKRQGNTITEEEKQKISGRETDSRNTDSAEDGAVNQMDAPVRRRGRPSKKTQTIDIENEKNTSVSMNEKKTQEDDGFDNHAFKESKESGNAAEDPVAEYMNKDFERRREAGKQAAAIRKRLGLTQDELALLMSTTATSVSVWETRGVSPVSGRTSPFKKFVQLMALMKQSTVDESFLSFELLKSYAAATARGGLSACYSKYARLFDPSYLSALRNTNLEALLLALLANYHIEDQGMEPPFDDIVACARNTFMPGYSTDDVISMASEIEMRLEPDATGMRAKKKKNG